MIRLTNPVLLSACILLTACGNRQQPRQVIEFRQAVLRVGSGCRITAPSEFSKQMLDVEVTYKLLAPADQRRFQPEAQLLIGGLRVCDYFVQRSARYRGLPLNVLNQTDLACMISLDPSITNKITKLSQVSALEDPDLDPGRYINLACDCIEKLSSLIDAKAAPLP